MSYRGSIPADLLRPYVVEFVGDEEERVSVLAEKTKLDHETVRRIFCGKYSSVEFDTADRILCAVDAVHAWHEEPFATIYQANPLRGTKSSKIRCTRIGCSNLRKPKIKGQPGPQSIYCSTQCKRADESARHRGYKTTMKSLANDRCHNGHDRSPENTTILGGRTICLLCKREAAARWRNKKRAA